MRTSAIFSPSPARVAVAGAIVIALAIAAPAAAAVSPSPAPSASPSPSATAQPAPSATAEPSPAPSVAAPTKRGDSPAPAGALPLPTAPPVASFSTSRTQSSAATHAIWVVVMSPDFGNEFYRPYNASQQGLSAAVDSIIDTMDYWNAVGNGHQTFTSVGNIPWDESYSITTTECTYAEVDDLMVEGQVIANAESSYSGAANEHLIILIARDHLCEFDDYATLGPDVNTGGVSVVKGAGTLTASRSWIRSLGLNMGFGYASNVRFDSGAASFSNDAANVFYGADWFDAMSTTLSGQPGGALSSPQLIDTGIWEEGVDFDYGFIGTNEHKINVVSALEGMRGIAVADPSSSDRFYIETRSFTGIDKKVKKKARAGGGPDLGKGVRLLLLDYELTPGTYVTSRQGKKSKAFYTAGNSFTSESGDVSFTVNKVTNDYATVELTVDNGELYPGVAGHDATGWYGDFVGFSSSPWTSTHGSDFTYSWQWLRDGLPIPGATSPTYYTTVDDIGSRISVRVMAYEDDAPDDIGAATSPESPVIKAVPLEPEPVTVTGTPRVGEELLAETDSWSTAQPVLPGPDLNYEFQWYRGKKKISGATDETYELSPQDLGKRVWAKLTVSDTGLVTTSVKSGKTSKVKKGNIEGSLVLGTSNVGHTITVNPAGITTPDVTYTYRWYRNGDRIDGATSASYTLKDKDRHKVIHYKVTASKPGLTSVSASGTPRNWTLYAAPAKPVVVGDLSVGSELSIGSQTFSAWVRSVTADSFEYQWYRGKKKIAGATSATYTLTGADAGKRISVKVTAHDTYFLDYIGKSAKTATVTS